MKKEYQILHKNYSKFREKFATYELHFNQQKSHNKIILTKEIIMNTVMMKQMTLK